MMTFYKTIHPNILFLTSILCLPSIFFQHNLVYLWIYTAIFIILLKLKNGRVRLLPSCLIFLAVLFFNLLTPSGKVYMSIGSFRITEGALVFGLEKASVLISMVFVSKYAISKDIRLKGKLGRFINHMFYFFDRLIDHKSVFSIKSPFISIDRILVEVYENNYYNDFEYINVSYKQSLFTWILCLFPALLGYAMLFLQFV